MPLLLGLSMNEFMVSLQIKYYTPLNSSIDHLKAFL